MKTRPYPHLLFALSGLVAFSSSACSEPNPRVATTAPVVVAGDPVPAPAALPAPAPDAPAEWSDIQALGYDDRADFLEGLGRLVAQLEKRIDELKSRRAALTAAQDPVAGDAALKALATSRTRLLSASTDMGKATPENWNLRRERVAAAWEEVRSDYEKADAAVPR